MFLERRFLNCDTNVTSGTLQSGRQKWQRPILSAQIKCLCAGCSSAWWLGLICCCCCMGAAFSAPSSLRSTLSSCAGPRWSGGRQLWVVGSSSRQAHEPVP